MPRNRRNIPREQRVSALLDVAERLFVEQSFDSVTMADIARQAGVQSGALYWYFPSKDQVLAAVMDRGSETLWRQLDDLPKTIDSADRLIYFLTSLRPLRNLHVAMHSRLAASDVVLAAHDKLMGRFRELATAALAGASLDADVSLAVESLCAAFEGAHMGVHLERSGTEITQFVLNQFRSHASPT